MRRAAVLVALVVAIAACSGGGRAEVVSAVGNEALLPLLAEAADALATLDTAVAEFCTAPDDARLETARQTWTDAEKVWERTDVANYYGPAEMLRTESKVDFEPVSAEGIDELLASDAVIDVAYVDGQIAASRRGLGAIELGLFTDLAAAGDPRRCELTTAAAAVAAGAAGELSRAWSEGVDGEPSGIEDFTGMESNDALADVVGAQYEILNRQTLRELGKALGVSSPDPEPEAIVEGPAGLGALRLTSQIEGIESTLRSGGDDSLLELIRSRSDDVATRMEETMESALVRLDAVDGSLSAAVEEEPGGMTALLEDLIALRDLIHVDVVSLLDLTLGFSDSDGDSG